MRRLFVLALPVLACLGLATGTAQAVVVDMSALGQTTVAYNPSARGGYYGVALLPGTCGDLSNATPCSHLQTLGVPTVTTSGGCADPALTPDLVLPDTGVCFHQGAVMHGNETFALTWDPLRRYWAGTRGYVEQFLRDVADGSDTLSSPYAVTSQYTDSTGRAGNRSIYGGGCIDYGNPNHTTNANTTCRFGSSVQTGPGNNYPSSGCTPTGNSFTYWTDGVNDVCLTDAQMRAEVRTVVSRMGMLSRVNHPGYTPLVTLLLPAGVEACLDQTNKLCSANGGLTPAPPTKTTTTVTGGSLAAGTYRVEVTYALATGESLASVPVTVKTTGSTSTLTIPSPPELTGVTVTGWYAYVTGPDGTGFARQQATPTGIGTSLTLNAPPVSGTAPPVQPFFCSYHSQVDVNGTVVPYLVQPWTAMTQCDEPDIPALPQNPPPDVLAKNVGMRLVSPLSQSQIAAIADPTFKGWFALDGFEVNDNGGCVPQANGLDRVTVGHSAQNPYLLQREFNNAGVMESDPNTYFGCVPNVLLTPKFVVPSSVQHGDEVVFDGSATDSTLLVPNSGYHWTFGDGSTATGPSAVHSYAKPGTYQVKLTVADRGGNTRSLTQTIQVLGPSGNPPTGSGGSPTSASKLKVRVQLMPQNLGQVVHHGLAVLVHSNAPADGFATLSVPHAAARRAGIRAGKAGMVVIGRGTVAGIKDGTVTLRVRMARATARKLSKLRHVSLALRLELVSLRGQHVAIDAAGRY